MKTALITGASGGIGIEITRYFLKEGYLTLAQYNKDEKSLITLKTEMEKAGIEGVLVPFKCDFLSEESIENAISFISKTTSHIDVLINNAGVDLYKLITDTTEKEWNDIFSINVKSAFIFSKYALNSMISQKRGKIVNVSSIWGQSGSAMEVAYSASKSALIGFTKALAKEVAPSNINVNCVCPGVIDTKMNDIFSSEEKADIIAETPLNRMGTAKEIAEIIGFLCSSNASYITGQTITADGGFNL